MKISVCAPSYRRPKVLTLAYLPFCRIYVDPSEAAAYRTANPGADIIECAPGVQGNLCRVRNHILDREFSAGADVVVIIDDDMTGIKNKCIISQAMNLCGLLSVFQWLRGI